jgi:two-component system, OmpR family, KDP operon response regulator KdpE
MYGSVSAVGTFDDGTLHVDFGQREVTIEGQPTHLSPKQYVLLVTLVRRTGQQVSVPELITLIWGDGSDPAGAARKALRAYVAGLRRELAGRGPRDSSAIETVPDGYRYRSLSG